MEIPDVFQDWRELIKHTATFQTLPDGFELKTDILLPKTLNQDKPHPIIIAYHGGGLLAGSRDHYDYQASWLPSYAANSNAIILSPDYSLLPQITAKEIIEDVLSLWEWVQTSLSSTLTSLAPGHAVDLDRILVQGGSAGGFTSSHLAMTYPSKIRAAILSYPMVGGFHERGSVVPKMIPKELIVPDDELEEWIAKQRALKEWTVTRMPSIPMYTTSTLLSQRLFPEVFGEDAIRTLQPVDCVVPKDDGLGLPRRVWIVHGREDSIVPCKYTEDYVAKIKQVGWKCEVEFTIVDDEPSEHGFDADWKVGDEKLARHLRWIDQVWLA